MAASTTYYPEFTKALYKLQSVMGQHRQDIITRGNFAPADVTAFDTLATAVNTACAWFGNYVEPE